VEPYTPVAIQLAERLATHAPGDLNRVFFTVSGGESVETAWKLAKQYFKLTGKPRKHKVVSRALAYHGTSAGALSITGLAGAKTDSSRSCRAPCACRTRTSTGHPNTVTTTKPSAVCSGPDRGGHRIRRAGHSRRGVP
jgi:adenosylmethionine-8-amino-7-oxononanoate aminotransferase